jgi:hypothetical protein
MGGHEKSESRLGAAAGRQQRSTDDAIMPQGHNIPQFLVSWDRRRHLLQLRVLGFGLLVDGNVGVGDFPEGEEILVGGERPDAGGISICAL